MALKECKTTSEMIEKYYSTDLKYILRKVINNKTDEEYEILLHDVCVRLLSQKRVEKFDRTKSSFATYMFMSIRSLAFSLMKSTFNKAGHAATLSLDAKRYDNDSTSLIDFIPDSRIKTESNMDFKFICEKLWAKYQSENKYKTKIHKLRKSDLLEAMLIGYHPSDIASLFDLTVPGVCSCRLNVREDFNKLANHGMDSL